MANPRQLVKRRKAVQNIRKITRTMELIATARFKKALDRATEAEAYTRKIAELAADLTAPAATSRTRCCDARPVKNERCSWSSTSNRGLAGGYNGDVLREAIGRIRELAGRGHPVRTWRCPASGRSPSSVPAASAAEPSTPSSRTSRPSTRWRRWPTGTSQLYITGEIDRVDVAYTKFINAARQTPVVETLLPLASVAPPRPQGRGREDRGRRVDYEFLPTRRRSSRRSSRSRSRSRLFKCFLDAAVSEQIARRVAMKAATENADDMIKTLTRQYNRARQAQITKEIAEIIGGAEALK